MRYVWIVLLALAACTPLSDAFDRGGVADAQFERDSEGCRLAASSSPIAGFYASNYRDCMRSKGYREKTP